MKFPDTDGFIDVQPGTKPPYDAANPLLTVVDEAARLRSTMAAGLESYESDSLQFLLPFTKLTLYGPSDGQHAESRPLEQNNKNDFQKQNIASVIFAPFYAVRGYVRAGAWTGCFLRLGYRGSPDADLIHRSGGDAGDFLLMELQMNGGLAQTFELPFNSYSGCYEVELWGYSDSDLAALLGAKGRTALTEGRIVQVPQLIKGVAEDFRGPGINALRDGLNRREEAWLILDHAPDHLLHPLRPLRLSAVFWNHDRSHRAPSSGAGYTVDFAMLLRGWQSYLGSGISRNPHGGVGFLEYRNLFSNYFGYETRREQLFGLPLKNELGRDLQPGKFNANTWQPGTAPPGEKVTSPGREAFMAVDYMDLHILQPDCSIGIHRHRDNQEAFLLLKGRGLMLAGSWMEDNDDTVLRAFELRTMQPGDITLCKTGQIHALYNVTDEEITLFMFGGYD